MKVVYTERHRGHDPRAFIHRGRLVDSPEQPSRADMLLAAARTSGHEVVHAAPMAADALLRVHTTRYLDFLEHGFAEWRKLPHAGDEMLPNTHPNRFASRYASHIVARAGFHQADTACPIGEGTWAAARASVDVALTVGELLEAGEQRAYGLCRPPGHHACTEMAWGFCYLNNIAVLAETLRRHGDKRRIAVLDIDVHHGNGTQQIFYERADVLTVSVHADPENYPVFYSGYTDEAGAGDGVGFNLNLPLAHGSGDEAFVAAIRAGLNRIEAYVPDVLLVALGLDAFGGDPLSVLTVTTDGFRRAGEAVGRFRGPVGMLQEGGYPCPELGDNLTAFLGAVDG
jgi:acetoin utilization deacetylase AcuC-like enzyme